LRRRPGRHTGRRIVPCVVTLARDPVHSSAFARTPPPDTGHSPTAPSSRGVPLPVRASHDLAGRRRFLPFCSSPPDSAHGVLPGPSQVCSRGRVDARLASEAAKSGGSTPHCCGSEMSRLARHFCRSGPTCRLVPPRPPRLIFVGVTDRLLERKARPAKAVGRGCGWRRLLGFSSRLRSASAGDSWAGGPILPWALPLAGFAGTLPCIGRARPRCRSPVPGTFVGRSFAPRRFQSARGFSAAPSYHFGSHRVA